MSARRASEFMAQPIASSVAVSHAWSAIAISALLSVVSAISSALNSMVEEIPS